MTRSVPGPVPPGRVAGEDGVISAVLAVSMLLFVGLLSLTVDLGQLWTARAQLAGATSAAARDAAEVLSQGGCAAYDLARAEAAARLADTTTTATLDTFEVAYGVVVVDDLADCALVVTDENVGRLDVGTSDTRRAIFRDLFLSGTPTTRAATSAEWGYVLGLNGGVRPLSLCSQNAAYQDFQTWLGQQALFEAGLGPAPDPTLLDPFDIEVDGFTGTPCADLDGDTGKAGEFVNVDFAASRSSQSTLAEWLDRGAPYNVQVADPLAAFPDPDCGDGAPNDAGHCRGVDQSDSTDRVADFLPLVGRTFPILLHDQPRCIDDDDFDKCDKAGERRKRAYPITGIARVELLCVRITAYPSTALASLVPDPDPLSPTHGSDCAGLSKAADADGNPGDDVMARLRFVVDTTISEGNLHRSPTLYNGFLGLSVCAVDGDDNCDF